MPPEFHLTAMADRSQQLIREAARHRLAKAATATHKTDSNNDGESYLAGLAQAARARRLRPAW